MTDTLTQDAAQTSPATLDTVETPALILDIAKVDRNITRLRGYLADLGAGFRPHVKTAKSLEVARRLFPDGIGPITVSTLAEAEYFAEGGFTDIVYAVGLAPEKIGRTCDLVAKGVNLAVLIDSIEQARALVDHACGGQAMPAVLVEIDCDGHRGGVLPGDPALVAMADALSRLRKKASQWSSSARFQRSWAR